MNFAQIRHYDTANGPGIRTSVFFSGCTHKCKGCFNEEYQDFSFGEKFTKNHISKIKTYLSEDYVAGLSILGGEPLEQNLDEMAEFLKEIKSSLRDDQNIWIYSGFTFEQIMNDEEKKNIIKHCDFLVDGRFVEEMKNLRLKFRGSENQRIIDIQKSLEEKKIILNNEI